MWMLYQTIMIMGGLTGFEYVGRTWDEEEAYEWAEHPGNHIIRDIRTTH